MASKGKSKSKSTRRPTAAPTVTIKEEVRMVPARGYGAPARRPAAAPIFVAPRATTAVTPRRKAPAGGVTRSTGEKVRKGAAVAGFVLGYVERNNTFGINDMTAKLPVIFGSKKLALAGSLHLLARRTKPGGYVDHLATATTAVAFYDLGTHGLTGGGLFSSLGLDKVAGSDEGNVASF